MAAVHYMEEVILCVSGLHILPAIHAQDGTVWNGHVKLDKLGGCHVELGSPE